MQGLFRLPAMDNSVIVTLWCEQTKLLRRRTYTTVQWIFLLPGSQWQDNI